MHFAASAVRRLGLMVRAVGLAARCARWTRARLVQLSANWLLTLARVCACCAVWAAQMGQMYVQKAR
eukprot:5611008-Pleurochrysis_carterae.AAC.1